jgi:multidrug efflux pump subunit AcrA (membrane-fusion protein)
MKQNYLIVIVASLLILPSCNSKLNETRPSRKDITELVFASGMLEADDQYSLTAQTDGYLVQMNFSEGTLVKKGQLLAVIDNDQNLINAQSASRLHDIARKNTLPSAPALQQIKANMQGAAAKMKVDLEQVERYKRLYKNNSVSKTEYETVQLNFTNSNATLNALQEQYQDQKVKALEQEVTQRYSSDVNKVIGQQNHLKALYAGKIFVKQKKLGDYVSKGEVIATVGSPRLIYARLNLDEANLSKLKIGQTIWVKLNTDKDKVYMAVLQQILPAFDQTSRSFLVKAYFKEKPDLDIIGTQLEANIVTGTKKNALVIPALYLGYGNKVTLKEGKKLVPVQPGIISTDWVEIIGGLKENETIIPPNY